MEVLIDDSQESAHVDLPRLHQLAQALLLALKCPQHTELSIALVDDHEIRRLNREYRGKDASTDVLAFALQEVDGSSPRPLQAEGETGPPLLLGDIILSTETAQRQAAALEHTFEQELSRLFIHGLLHLLGYDHHTDEDAQRMDELQHTLFMQIDSPFGFTSASGVA
ncbi:rRNA maturation RNase YbeY [candidate division KSB3 bacterium]|uniref:Endoribonuclease YbeY n=1 Tax=candidate division KSB3 bacterium TaxID=2044937 RepID=A0A9D5JT86_9BACT|nr:rRNA maturation RNase YbeY [candidate division KSB3 bacterium]MBD3323659.1 rRNA maturation RNase YbeY [candidate division KSB3 bacterium]